MASRYLIKRGKRALYRRAVAHLAVFDRQGRIVGAECGRAGFDMSSNVCWGLRTCKDCLRRRTP